MEGDLARWPGHHGAERQRTIGVRTSPIRLRGVWRRLPPRTSRRRAIGAEVYRVGSWRGLPGAGYLTPSTGTAPATPAAIATLTDELHDEGYDVVHTAALGEADIGPYAAVGYRPRERLHLLRHDLRELPDEIAAVRTRPGRRSDREPVLDLDRRAFDSFWALDDDSLDEALTATPRSRLRVAVADRTVRGYAVTGRAGAAGYLQRLAVDPDLHGSGMGTTLVRDALHWLRRSGCTAAMVNTQEHNSRALGLYTRLGFVAQPTGLVIMSHVAEAS